MSVDATLGGANSDSYLSNADADAYWVDRNEASWAAASAAAQDAALREATQYLDAKYTWTGVLLDTAQALNWPRSNAYDKELRPLTGIPKGVQDATAELALQALSGPLVSPAADRGGRTKKEKVGDIEVEYFESSSSKRLYEYVDLLVTGLSNSQGSYVEIIRG